MSNYNNERLIELENELAAAKKLLSDTVRDRDGLRETAARATSEVIVIDGRALNCSLPMRDAYQRLAEYAVYLEGLMAEAVKHYSRHGERAPERWINAAHGLHPDSPERPMAGLKIESVEVDEIGGDKAFVRELAEDQRNAFGTVIRAPEVNPISPSEEYRRKNPLGGPANLFRAIAERIEAGEDYDLVLRDMGVTVHSPLGDHPPETTPIGDQKLMPDEPTDAMFDAFKSVNCTFDAEVERLTFSGDYGNWLMCYLAMRAAAPSVEQYRLDNSKDAADAARYRWLRDNAIRSSGLHMDGTGIFHMIPSRLSRARTLDEAIDAKLEETHHASNSSEVKP